MRRQAQGAESILLIVFMETAGGFYVQFRSSSSLWTRRLYLGVYRRHHRPMDSRSRVAHLFVVFRSKRIGRHVCDRANPAERSRHLSGSGRPRCHHRLPRRKLSGATELGAELRAAFRPLRQSI